MTIESGKRRLRELAQAGVDVSAFRSTKTSKGGKTRSVWNITESDLPKIAQMKASMVKSHQTGASSAKPVKLKTAKQYLHTMEKAGVDVSFYKGMRVSKWGVIMGTMWNISDKDISTITQMYKDFKDGKEKEDARGGVIGVGGRPAPTSEQMAVYESLISKIQSIDVGTNIDSQFMREHDDRNRENFVKQMTDYITKKFESDPRYYAEYWLNNMSEIDSIIEETVMEGDSDTTAIYMALSSRLFELI